jgi:L-amino acid N-acyltransferase
MLELIPLARKAGYHSIIAGISGDQEPSIALHEALGFRKVAHIVEGGFKMGRWLDVVYLQLML